MRPSFLVLTPACIALGVSTALASMQMISMPLLFLVVLGAVTAHLSVNLLNEYYDFKSGLDHRTHRTPFNGGSGALIEHANMALLVLGAGLVMMVVTSIIGVYFVYESGFGILLIGLMGMVVIVSYTQWINRMPVICLIAPGLGFGMFMVVGTHIALVKEPSVLVFAVALIPFFLVNNLLLINQYPDIEADKHAERFHYVIAYGVDKSTRVYIGFAATAYILLVIYVLTGLLPPLTLMALATLPLSCFTAYGAIKYKEHIAEHLPFMAANAAAAILTPILLAVAIFIAY